MQWTILVESKAKVLMENKGLIYILELSLLKSSKKKNILEHNTYLLVEILLLLSSKDDICRKRKKRILGSKRTINNNQHDMSRFFLGHMKTRQIHQIYIPDEGFNTLEKHVNHKT